ncbi:helix-turn-helix transcriptional regulator [Sphingopyxis sp. JAI128]|uniref:ArsR/SmtB family transcription factor n=1 Tax=Sphingopyxis sp. JAI128 TaxID=2723066 RepID=UPI001622276C|nr:metalloregulator ArsR/SmtB family transcription factor [Sphingopyxis sp. JAI128]MBB6426145.1 DNA-binding transcriptional ArsR family regulator [Sphingopyxis sp. JAI128]
MSAAVDRTLAALADPVRRRAVELLGQQPRSAGELAGALGLAPPAMSRHLRALKDGGLVEDGHPDFDARVRIYSLKDGATDGLKQWLAATEALWMHQLAAFKHHVEGGVEGVDQG